MNVSIIIPNYNGEALLRKNLPKVFEAGEYYAKETQKLIEVVVIDDCSTDNSVKEIQNLESRIQNLRIKFKIIKNEKNLGFAKSINKGVESAGGEIVVLLNSDVAPEKEFLVPLIRHFKDEKVFAVGCMDKSIEGSKIILRGRGVGEWQRGFLVHSRGEVNKKDTLWVNGGSGAFKKQIWEKLGGFNTIYNPFYWEDIDLSYRAQKSGYKVFFEPKSVVVHEHEKGAIKAKFNSSQIKTITYRNQFLFVWINATDLNLQFLHIFWLPYHFLIAVKNLDIAFLKGLFFAFTNLPEVITFRLKAQKNIVKSDKEVIKNMLQ